MEVLSQLSRELLGEWQAERYTMTYETLAYPRTGPRPTTTPSGPRARCDDAKPGPSQSGVVVTFRQAPLVGGVRGPARGRHGPLDAPSRPSAAIPRMTSRGRAAAPPTPTCELQVCRDMGVTPDGVVAAVGYFDGPARDALAGGDAVARSPTCRMP